MLILPEHSGAYVRKLGGWAKYHLWCLKEKIARFDSRTQSLIRLPQSTVKKIGRNSPCICGSGKKYKKCCINK